MGSEDRRSPGLGKGRGAGVSGLLRKAVTLSIKGRGSGAGDIVQELCESRGGRPELSVLTSLLVSVDVTNY